MLSHYICTCNSLMSTFYMSISQSIFCYQKYYPIFSSRTFIAFTVYSLIHMEFILMVAVTTHLSPQNLKRICKFYYIAM